MLFSEEAKAQLAHYQIETPYLEILITEVIGQNPKPQFHQDPKRIYGIRLKSWNIRFKTAEEVDLMSLEQGSRFTDEILNSIQKQRALMILGIEPEIQK